MIFFLYLLVLCGFIFSLGFFSVSGVFILLLSIIFLLIGSVKKNIFKTDFFSPKILLLLLSLLSLAVYGGLYQKNVILILLSFALLTLNVFLSLLFVKNDNAKVHKSIFLAMLAIAMLVRLFMIWSSPSPHIDVYDFLRLGALGFARGENPYTMTYTKLYKNVTPDYYQYLPGMIFQTIPFVAVLGDPRYALIAAEFLVAFLIFKISKKKEDGFIYSLIILNNPISSYMIEQSYTEPLILALLVLFAWFFVRKKNYIAAITFGLLLATKQHAIVLLPILFQLFSKLKNKIKLFFLMVFTATIIILPFYFWSPADFMHDTVFLLINSPPRYDGLTFFSFLYRFGISYNFILSAGIISFSLLFIYTRKLTDLSSFFYLSASIFLVIFFFNKWSYINYYYFIAQLLLVSGILKKENP